LALCRGLFNRFGRTIWLGSAAGLESSDMSEGDSIDLDAKESDSKLSDEKEDTRAFRTSKTSELDTSSASELTEDDDELVEDEREDGEEKCDFRDLPPDECDPEDLL